MKKILVATHGDFAKGILSASSIIVGKKDRVSTINAYTEDKLLKKAIDDFFETVQEDDEVIVLSDIFGGSVNQGIMPYMNDRVYMITGVNLPLLLEILLMNDEQRVDVEDLRRLVCESGKQVILVNDVVQSTISDDFDI